MATRKIEGPCRIHMTVTPRYLLAKESADFLQSLDLKPSEEEMARAMLRKLVVKGHRLPVGDCDNFDPKSGCQGHPLEE